MHSLVDAALLDQERRILDASPKEVMGTRYQRRREGAGGGNCGVCGSKLFRHNKSGFCSKTAECRAAQQRDWNKHNLERRREIAAKAKERAKAKVRPPVEDKGDFFPVVPMPDGGFSLTSRGVACGPEEHKARKG
jgi:hypothetical protein